MFLSIGSALMQASAAAATLDDELRRKAEGGDKLLSLSGDFRSVATAFQQHSDECRALIEAIAGDGTKLSLATEGIRDALLHLRSCALTLKVIGARYPEIAGFAQEMIDGIAAIKDRVERLRDGVLRYGNSASAAGMRERPGLEAALSPMTEPPSSEPEQDHIARLVRECQRTLAELTGGMQAGDIAIQRLEHIDQALSLVEQQAVNEADRTRFMALVCDQLEDTLGDLTRQTAGFGSGFELLADRLGEADHHAQALRLRLAQHAEQLRDELVHFSQAMEASVALARSQMTQSANLLATGETDAQSFLRSVASMRIATTDIHYMALNTNLSCSRLGGDAKSADPITAEVRYYAVGVAATIDEMLTLAENLGTSVARCRGFMEQEPPAPDFSAEHNRLVARAAAHRDQLGEAFGKCSALAKAAKTMDADRHAFDEVLQALTRSLGVLTQEVDAAGPQPQASSAAEGLSLRIFALYTMNSERELHKRHFAVAEDSQNCDPVNVFAAPAAAEPVDLKAVLF